MDASILTSEGNLRRIESKREFFRGLIGGKLDEWFTLFNCVSAPPVALRTVGDPFFRFPLAVGTEEGEIGRPAQFERLLKLLSSFAEILLMEIDFRQEPMKGWKILPSQADLVDLLQGLVQHLQP